MELQHGNGQAVNQASAVLRHIQPMKHDTSYEIESVHQIPPPSVETALRWNVRKQVPMLLPMAQQFSLYIPASTFANQGQGYQLTVAAKRLRSGSLEQRSNLVPDVINDGVHPRAKIFKIGYHMSVLRCE
jgi:hypothetical protein